MPHHITKQQADIPGEFLDKLVIETFGLLAPGLLLELCPTAMNAKIPEGQ
jgi:hypothetical protein